MTQSVLGARLRAHTPWAAAAALGLVLTTAPLALADTVRLDGDIVKTGQGVLEYGDGARDCATRGQAVSGVATVQWNMAGGGHFTPGESLSFEAFAPEGVAVAVVGNPTVPSDWKDKGEFEVFFTTTVDPSVGTVGGHVEIELSGKEYTPSGRPQFPIHVACDTGSTPVNGTPTIDVVAPDPDGANGWHRTTPVWVTYEARDPDPEGKLAEVKCLVNGLAAEVIGTPASGKVSVSEEGTHQVVCTAKDDAGATASDSVEVKIDSRAPVLTGPTRAPLAVAGTNPTTNLGWDKGNVSWTWTCADDTTGTTDTSDVSGVDQADSSISRLLENEGLGQLATAACADRAGNSSSATSPATNIDKTAPALNIDDSKTTGGIDICAPDAQRPTFAPTDPLSGVASFSDSWTKPAGLGLGSFTYRAQASDWATHASSAERVYQGVYGSAFSGVLQPINADGSSRFKLGSTIPVKFKLSCNGTPVTNARATLSVSQSDSTPDAGVEEAVSTSAATTGNLFRYSADGQQYIFNLSTKDKFTNPNGQGYSFSQGTWYLRIGIDDGSTKQVKIQLCK